MRVLAWPATSSNPDVAELYRSIGQLDPSIDVVDFRPLTAWRHRADVVHVHWPEIATRSPSLPRAVAKSSAVLATLVLAKLRGAIIIWTCHDLRDHERHTRLDGSFRAVFERLVDGVIHLTEHSATVLADSHRLGSKPATVAPYCRSALDADDAAVPDQAAARAELGLDPDLPILATLGAIRPDQRVPQLIEAFADMSVPAHLIVAGNPEDDRVRADIVDAAAGVDRLLLDLRSLTDEEIALRVRAADVVVAADEEVTDSGAAILALGLGRPVAARPTGAMLEVADAVGPDWVDDLDGPISGARLDDVAEWASKPRQGEPDLRAYSPQVAAQRTLGFFRRLTDTGSPIVASEPESSGATER